MKQFKMLCPYCGHPDGQFSRLVHSEETIEITCDEAGNLTDEFIDSSDSCAEELICDGCGKKVNEEDLERDLNPINMEE